MFTFSDAIVANILALLGVLAAVWSLAQKNRERLERRHEENLNALNDIRLEIAKLSHLDPCVDELKQEILMLRKRLHQLADTLQVRKADENE